MTRIISRSSGFSLVELLITVVVIGILATLAIPYFSAYRMKGYNSAAVTDLHNFKLVLEAFYADNRHYP